jgi:Tfp pilus assembly protein PilO
MSSGMLFQLVGIILCVLAAGACVAAVVWTIRRGDVHQRALRQTAREAGVSERYLEEVLANNADLGERRISVKEWKRRAMQIAYRYPSDSKIGDLLREEQRGTTK